MYNTSMMSVTADMTEQLRIGWPHLGIILEGYV